MRYLEIIPRNGSHYLVLDGREISRHNDVRIAEAVRCEILRQSLCLDSADGGCEPPTNQNARLKPCQVRRALQYDEQED